MARQAPRGRHTKKTAASGARPRRRARAPGSQPADFLVVGVGASAGGIEALKEPSEALPGDADLALVVIVHLDPTAQSTLAELLARHANMPVQVARDGALIEPRNIYLIAPGTDLDVRRGRLAVTPQVQGGLRLPIDHFLGSMAEAFHDRAAAVILSGAGADGTLGVRAVKEAGGLTIAQDPDEAQHDNMPRSAIGTGAIDKTLRVREIPAELINFRRHRRSVTLRADEMAPPEANGTLAETIDLLKRSKGQDFSVYKSGTLMRRIGRRMALAHHEKPTDYLDFLRNSPDEQETLYKDLLINVTAFFRDIDAFDYLERRVVPDLVRRQAGDRPLRVWVPARSTGEEAYSIAMRFIEALTAAGKPVRLQVFATDVDLDALDKARRGTYPGSIKRDVSPARLERFFSREDHGYTVRPFLRECVIVSAQNVLTDAPFSNIDLISCRNLSIYLKPKIQAQLLLLFHFGLAPGGVLVLGSSENIGSERARFEPVSARHRIFRRSTRNCPRSTISFKSASRRNARPPQTSPTFWRARTSRLCSSTGS
jgi:two-component system, chemotaxis family, CheB/CheR fusion protein